MDIKKAFAVMKSMQFVEVREYAWFPEVDNKPISKTSRRSISF